MLKEVYVCKRLRLYNWLIEHGFASFCKRRDRENYKYYVWMFSNSQALQDCISEYYNNVK